MTVTESHYARLAAMYAAAPINTTIPSRVTVGEGHAEVTLHVSSDYWHAAGSLHGSLYFKGLDDAAFFAANSVVPEAFVLTAKFEVQLLAKVTTDTLRAVGTLDARDGKKLQASSVLYAGDQVVARGSGLFVVSDMPLDGLASYRDG